MKKLIALIFVCLTLVSILTACGNSKFKQTKSEVVKIVGMVGGGDDYFTIDTKPDIKIYDTEYEDNALKGIRYANENLGFNGSLYSEMLNTSALMGRQTEENEKYEVLWTYHPDEGLEVTYKIK